VKIKKELELKELRKRYKGCLTSLRKVGIDLVPKKVATTEYP